MKKVGFEMSSVSQNILNSLHNRVAKQAEAKIKRKQKKRAIDLNHQAQFTDNSVKRKRLELEEEDGTGLYTPSSISTKLPKKS